jgi:Tfp pilus assembly protein PilF
MAVQYDLKALEQNPENFQAMVHLALVHLFAGRGASADAWIRQAERLRPEHGDVRLRRCEYEFATGQYQAGLRRLTALLAEHPYFVPAQRLYANVVRRPEETKGQGL